MWYKTLKQRFFTTQFNKSDKRHVEHVENEPAGKLRAIRTGSI